MGRSVLTTSLTGMRSSLCVLILILCVIIPSPGQTLSSSLLKLLGLHNSKQDTKDVPATRFRRSQDVRIEDIPGPPDPGFRVFGIQQQQQERGQETWFKRPFYIS